MNHLEARGTISFLYMAYFEAWDWEGHLTVQKIGIAKY
jgi:hypothetical protein